MALLDVKANSFIWWSDSPLECDRELNEEEWLGLIS